MFVVSLDLNGRVRDVFNTAIYVDEGVQTYPITPEEQQRLNERGANGDFRYVDGVLVFDPFAPQPTEVEIIKSFTDAIQKRLDDFARTRNYDGILSAATYATSTVPKFQAEGQYAVQARDATWYEAYRILAEVQAGTRPMPSQPSDIFHELPVLVWPNERP